MKPRAVQTHRCGVLGRQRAYRAGACWRRISAPSFKGPAEKLRVHLDPLDRLVCATRLGDLSGARPGLVRIARQALRAGYAVTGVDLYAALSARPCAALRRQAGLAMRLPMRNCPSDSTWTRLLRHRRHDLRPGALVRRAPRRACVAFASSCGRAAARSTCSRGASSRPSRSARRGRSIRRRFWNAGPHFSAAMPPLLRMRVARANPLVICRGEASI